MRRAALPAVSAGALPLPAGAGSGENSQPPRLGCVKRCADVPPAIAAAMSPCPRAGRGRLRSLGGAPAAGRAPCAQSPSRRSRDLPRTPPGSRGRDRQCRVAPALESRADARAIDRDGVRPGSGCIFFRRAGRSGPLRLCPRNRPPEPARGCRLDESVVWWRRVPRDERKRKESRSRLAPCGAAAYMSAP